MPCTAASRYSQFRIAAKSSAATTSSGSLLAGYTQAMFGAGPTHAPGTSCTARMARACATSMWWFCW